MRILVTALALLTSSCATTTEPETVTLQKEFAPHLWSDHKQLNTSPDLCATKGQSILGSLGFTSIVRNGYFVYGNFSSNRAVIKCVATDDGTFVYAAVAGPKVKIVEKLRNEIVWQL